MPPVDPAEIAAALESLTRKIGTQSRTLGDAIARFRADRVRPGLLKPASLRAYRMALERLQARWGMACLQSTDWAQEATELLAGAGKQAWRELQTLRMVLVFAGRLGWRHGPHGIEHILRRAEYTPRDDVYSETQICRLLRSLGDLDSADPSGEVHRAVIRALVYTGCRISEICKLQESEVRGDHIRLRDSKTGARTIPLCLEAQEILRLRKPVHGWLFPGRKSHVTVRSVLDRFHEARKHAGLGYGTPHTIRHSWATIAIRSGAPPQAVQRVLGHSSSWMTARYVHLGQRDAHLAAISFAAQLKR